MKRRFQQGYGLIGWCFILFFVGSFCTFFIKIGPIYLDHHTIVKLVQDLKDEDRIKESMGTPLGASTIKELIDRRLYVNGISALKKDDITIGIQGNNYEISFTYEERVNLISNIDVVVHFEDTVEVPCL